MTWEPRPLPVPSPETERFWHAASEGVFLLQTCQQCGLTFFYPRTLCPDCFADELEWTAAEGTGAVYTFTAADRVDGWPDEQLPVTVAYVELDEGPRIMTVLRTAADVDIAVGDRVEVDFVPTKRDDISIPVFTPI